MTIEKLNNIKKFDKRIALLEHRLAVTRAKSVSVAASQLSGMPRGSGIGDRVGTAVANIDELKRDIHNVKRRRKRLVAYILCVEEKYMRDIMISKFIDGDTWEAIAAVIGNGNTKDSVRKSCERFLAREKSDKTRFPRA